MPENIGDKIRALRKQAGITQEELGDLLSVSYMTVRRWEAGKVVPRLDEIKALANALKVQEQDFLSDNTEAFHLKLRELRKKAGLNQTQLAEKIGVSLLTLFRWEKGERQPRVEDIRKLANALNVSENDLLSNDISTQPKGWVLTVKIAQDFSEEVIDLSKGLPIRCSITATPEGAFLSLGGNWELWNEKDGYKKLAAQLKKIWPTVIQNGIGLGGIPS